MAELRLIDANEIIRGMEEIMRSPWFNDDKYTRLVKKDAFHVVKNLCVDSSPTIDAVPVVRCRECKYAHPLVKEGWVACIMWCRGSQINGFCHMGEKMDGGAEG